MAYVILAAMEQQAQRSNMKNEIKTATLDGVAWKAVKAADNGTINTAAEAADALSIAAGEWLEARLAVEKAEADAAAAGKRGVAAIKAVADRLHDKIKKRKKATDAYGEELFAKEAEVATLHPGLCGVLAALMQYATGEVKIDKPLAYIDLTGREYVPEVTDENRAALAAFKPLRRNPPDTSALRVSVGAEAAPFSGLIAARTRYETACQALADTLKIYEDALSALAAEADAEAESVEKALAIQAERDAKAD